MQRTIKACGVEFDVDYEWDDNILVDLCVSIDGQDVTEVIADKVTEKISETLYGLYGEDMADRADYLFALSKEMRAAA